MVVPFFSKYSTVVWILFFAVTSIEGDRTSSKIYEKIEATLACFRRMNATHQTGCSSKLSGNVGVLHLVDSPESLKWVTETGPHSPYVAVMTPQLFTRPSLTAIRDSGRVEGILLMRKTSGSPLPSFSNEKTCPNTGYGLYTNPEKKPSHYCEKWNDDGTGLLFENWDFPIFLIDKEDQAVKVKDCFHKFNKDVNGTMGDWPLCAAQLESHMMAAVDSRVCIRRTNVFSLTPTRICDPMGDYNIYGSIVPRSQEKPYSNGSVIVIGARLDASSMFDKISPGADSTVSGFTALAAVLKLLSSWKDKLLKSSTVENIYFIVFNGEAFDYIGSGRIVYDMKNNSFPFSITDNSSSQPAPLKLEHIKYFIEFNQVFNTDTAKYFVHSANSTEVQELVSLLQSSVPKSANKFQIVNGGGSQGLPPSSFQSFRAGKSNLPGIVITNHDLTYTNKYYNSIYDTDEAVGYVYKNRDSSSIQNRISELAQTVAQTVLNISLPGEIISPDGPELLETVDEILYCYLQSSNCTLFTEVIGNELPDNFPLPLYVGVQYNINPLTMYTRSLLSYYQGSANNMTSKDCVRSYLNQTVDYLWIKDECYETTMNYSAALSPAFKPNGEISWDEWNSGLYSTWTESVWQKLNVRIFLKPSRTHEILTLSFGIALFLVSFVIIGWISKKSDVIFLSRPDMIC